MDQGLCWAQNAFEPNIFLPTIISNLKAFYTNIFLTHNLFGQKYVTKRRRQHVRIQQRSSSTEACLPLQVVLHRRSPSTKGHLPPMVVFHRRSSFTEGRLPPKVVLHRRLSSTEGRHPPKVVYHQRWFPPYGSSTAGCLPLKVILLLKVVFHQRLSSTYHNTLVNLIFVRAANIPNLGLLPAMHNE